MEKNGKEGPAIGINFGTTYSVGGVWLPEHNRVEIFRNTLGSQTTPSMVAFTPFSTLAGQAAKNQAVKNPSNSIFESKGLIGRRFSDATVQEDTKLWPFDVTILHKMRQIVEARLGKQVKDAVITVPAYFNDSQRQATKYAGEIVGLNVLRVINEPTAAAMAYGRHKKMTDNDAKKNVLVFDLGGGTLDVSLISIANNTYVIKAVSGDIHLGGGDFDCRMVNHFVAEFRRKHSMDISGNLTALGKLRVVCERAKRNLSSSTETPIQIDSLFEGVDFSSTITRARFENMNLDLFTKCTEEVDKCLKDAKMEKSDIHDVVLVGGSTRIPKIQSLLKDLFHGKELFKCIEPDETIANGAAFQAAILSKVDTNINNDVVIMDVTLLSLGIKLHSGNMVVVVPRRTTYPTRMSYRYVTVVNNQTGGLVKVYEGERPKAEDNHLLGLFTLCGFPPTSKGEQEFDLHFDIDAAGFLTVLVQYVGTKKKKEIAIASHSKRLPKKEIIRITTDAMQYFAKAEHRKIASLARNTLEDYVFSVMGCLTDEALITTEKIKLQLAIEGAIQWLEQNSLHAQACEFEDKLSELQSIFEHI